jgi:VCBS repeat protein/ASPIC/UnbV protein
VFRRTSIIISIFSISLLFLNLGRVVAAPVDSALTDLDPLCRVTNLSLSVSNSGQPASTRGMIERLARIRATMNPMQAKFLSRERVQIMASALAKMTNEYDKADLRLKLAFTLTEANQSEAALVQFNQLETFSKAAGQAPSPEWLSAFRVRKGLNYLRLGEEQNCLLNHNEDSCILPLRPGAFHQVQAGSRGAVGVFTEQLEQHPDDLLARWLLNIGYMTLGEYPKNVPERWLIPPKVFDSDYPLPRFVNVAGPLGLDLDGPAGGCILDDFDNDGFIDIIFSPWTLDGQIRFLRNDGHGHFIDQTVAAGLAGYPGGLNIQQMDYNNDGFLDIWINRGAWFDKQGRIPGSLLRNNGNGTFTDVTESAGLLSAHPSQASCWFDFDGDGWLDLFKGNENTDDNDPDPCELFHNNHDGTFTECASSCGVNFKSFVKGVTCADYDHDGRPDLYLSILGAPNKLLHNEGPDSSGQCHFRDVASQAGVTEPQYSFPTWFFDYDNDGWEDIFVSGYRIQSVADIAADYLGQPNHGTPAKLYHNNHDGTFSDVTESAHLNHVLQTMGSNFGDLDNDGWLDFYLGTGDPSLTTVVPNRMFRNAHGRFFQDVTTSGGFGHLQKGHAIGFADFRNNGQQDVFSVMGGAYSGDHARSALFLNPGNTNHWLTLKLEGTKSNRAAIGARIRVELQTPEGPQTVYKTVNSGGSFGSSPLRQTIGLGQATGIVKVAILWPAAGPMQLLTGFDLDQAYRIREDKPEPMAWYLKAVPYDLSSAHESHHIPSGH